MKIFTALLFIALLCCYCCFNVVSANNQQQQEQRQQDIEKAIKVWNQARDQQIRDNKLPHKKTDEYTSHSDRMMRAFTAEIPDGEELDRNMKKYEKLKENIVKRISPSYSNLGKSSSVSSYPSLSATPTQVHISLTGNPGNVSVMWATSKASTQSQVCYRPKQGNVTNFVCSRGEAWTYSPISLSAWEGMIHLAYMAGLVPGEYFEYYVTDPSLPSSANPQSQIFSFKAPQPDKQEVFAMLGGDMGTVQLCGHLVADQMKNDLATKYASNPPDFFFLIGDIAYSTLDPPKDSFEFFWDWFLDQEQDSLSGAIPLLVSPGNHDAAGGDWAGFMNRFRTPQNKIEGNGNFYWAMEYGPIKYISMCTEPGLSLENCDYSVGSKQYQWIEQQLQNVDRSRTPWVIHAGHRPMLSSDLSTDSGYLPETLYPLFQKYGVDASLAGHMHESECALMSSATNGRNQSYTNMTGVTKVGPNSWRMSNPANTVVITAGALGAVIDEKFIEPQPEWSLARGGTFFTAEENYGYATMKATMTTLLFEFHAQKTGDTLWSIMLTK